MLETKIHFWFGGSPIHLAEARKTQFADLELMWETEKQVRGRRDANSCSLDC